MFLNSVPQTPNLNLYTSKGFFKKTKTEKTNKKKTYFT